MRPEGIRGVSRRRRRLATEVATTNIANNRATRWVAPTNVFVSVWWIPSLWKDLFSLCRGEGVYFF